MLSAAGKEGSVMDLLKAGAKHDEISLGDSGYPTELKPLGELAPDRLCFIGDLGALVGNFRVVVTGTRRATPYGMACAEIGARATERCGAAVLVGGAMGCETAAMRRALNEDNAPVVWLGTGANVPYPSVNEALFREVLEAGGCIVSAAAWDAPATPYAFQRRNLYMGAMADAVVICEAELRSGTYDLADKAEGKVYAFPGSVFAAESVGTNALVASGKATPVTDEGMLYKELCKTLGRVPEGRAYDRPARRAEDDIVSALATGPMRPGELIDSLGYTPLEVLERLAKKETEGRVVRLPDGRWCLSKDEYLAYGGIPEARAHPARRER